jgi:hypothetical protein
MPESISIFPGPVSKATMDPLFREGRLVILAMPPRFRKALSIVLWVKAARWKIGASGAPSPPEATSVLRKSETTGIPNASVNKWGLVSWVVCPGTSTPEKERP